MPIDSSQRWPFAVTFAMWATITVTNIVNPQINGDMGTYIQTALMVYVLGVSHGLRNLIDPAAICACNTDISASGDISGRWIARRHSVELEGWTLIDTSTSSMQNEFAYV